MFPVTVQKPVNLKELWKIAGASSLPCKYLAGGTDLCVQANNSQGMRALWLDISDIPELVKIKETKTELLIGACARLSGLEENSAVKRWAPALASAAGKMASPSLRNMATLGGNCANASPAGDGACALCAEGALAVLELKGKRREVPVENLFTGPRKTILRKNELITGFKIKKTPHLGVFMKLSPRRSFSISKASAALALWIAEDEIIRARLALGAVGPTILRCSGAETYLAGRKLSAADPEEVRRLAGAKCSPITDHRSTCEYRKVMTGVLAGRALKALLESANPLPVSPHAKVKKGGF